MKKKTTIILCVALATITIISVGLFSFWYWKRKSEETIKPQFVENQQKYTETILSKKNSDTEYKIIVENKANERISYAAEELKKYFKIATGNEIEIVSDESMENIDKILSVGKNKRYLSSGILTSFDETGDDGFILKTIGDAIYINGYSDDGTLYGVYDFLERTFGYRFYTAEEYACEKKEVFYLPDFNIIEKPAIAERSVGRYAVQSDNKLADKLRVAHGVGRWGLWAHSLLDHRDTGEPGLMSQKKYIKDHPEWYSLDGQQLCLTNVAMQAELLDNLKREVENNPDAEYFMLGQADYNSFCDRDDCECHSLIEKYRNSDGEGGEAAVMILFVNKIASQMKTWLQEKYPERANILFITFAYYKTEPSPCEYDEKTGKYILTHPELKTADNVGVMFAPINSCFRHSIENSDCNIRSRKNLYGWEQISDKLFVWNYCQNFKEILVPFNNYDSIAETYRSYANHNVCYIFDQGWMYNQTVFQNLDSYVQAKLMWNPYLDVNVLVEDFLLHFYGEGGKYIKEVYDLVRMRFLEIDNNSEKDIHVYCHDTRAASTDVWPRELVKKMEMLCKRAEEVVLQSEEEETKKKEFIIRIRRESLFPRYLNIINYRAYYTKEELKNYIDDFYMDAIEAGVNELGTANNMQMSAIVENWKNNL